MLQFVNGIKLGAMCEGRELQRFHRYIGRHRQLWEEGLASKPWAGSLLPTYNDGFAILIESNDQHFCKENSATHINKGGKSNEAVREASHDVVYLAGCRQVRDQYKFGTCNRMYRSAVGHLDLIVGDVAS